MMTKKVNGQEITLSAEEEVLVQSEWDINSQPPTEQEIDAVLTIEADIEVRFDSTLKAFALVVLSEINSLRVNAGLPERTIQQLKTAVKAKL